MEDNAVSGHADAEQMVDGSLLAPLTLVKYTPLAAAAD